MVSEIKKGKLGIQVSDQLGLTGDAWAGMELMSAVHEQGVTDINALADVLHRGWAQGIQSAMAQYQDQIDPNLLNQYATLSQTGYSSLPQEIQKQYQVIASDLYALVASQAPPGDSSPLPVASRRCKVAAAIRRA